MKKKDRELLFRDLSARLPYGVWVKVWLPDGTTEEGTLDLSTNYGDVLRDAFYGKKPYITDIKPYLRQLGTMTEAEIADGIRQVRKGKILYTERDGVVGWYTYYKGVYRYFDDFNWKLGEYGVRNIDWLLKHHFDIRELLINGLALHAPEGMYDKEKKI